MPRALMIVDVQNGFYRADFWGPRNNPDCEANIAALLHAWEGPLVFVRHDSEEPGSPLAPGQPGNDFKPIITGTPDLLITKQTNSCFYGEPDLHAWLQERGITELAICGITTNHCCETTARMAGNLGYDVQFVIDATHTFDRGGLTADELARATEANLHGEFASVVRTDEIMRSAG